MPLKMFLCEFGQICASPYRRALHIPVQILAGKFKIQFLPTISLTKAFPEAQIRPNMQKIVSSSVIFL